MESDAPVSAARKMNLHHLDPKSVIAHRAPVQQQRKAIPTKADDVFPLSENDLKEF